MPHWCFGPSRSWPTSLIQKKSRAACNHVAVRLGGGTVYHGRSIEASVAGWQRQEGVSRLGCGCRSSHSSVDLFHHWFRAGVGSKVYVVYLVSPMGLSTF